MSESQPSGWYPNPFSAREEIFWDGAAWTGETRAKVDVLPPAATAIPGPSIPATTPDLGVPTSLTGADDIREPVRAQLPDDFALTESFAEVSPKIPTADRAMDQQNYPPTSHPSPVTTAPNIYPTSAPTVLQANQFGLIALILGIVALVMAVIPGASLFAWLFALPAIVLGVIGLVRPAMRRGRALAGVIEGVVAMVIGIAVSVAFIAGLSSTNASNNHLTGDKPARPAPAVIPTRASSPSPSPTTTPTVTSTEYGVYPASESNFVRIVNAAENKLSGDATDLQESQIIKNRDAAMCRVLSQHQAKDWVGTIHDIGANGDGYAYVEVEIAPTIVVQTWNNAFSDYQDHTLIKPSQPFFKTLVPMEVGQKVTFTAKFLTSSDSCFTKANLTQTFYGLDPNFIARFSDVAKQG
jgi:hypothetical protein